MGLLHASLLNVMPEVKLVALCDKSQLMKRLFKKIFKTTGIGIVDDLEKLSDLNLDAVYVTTPISSHAPIVKNLYEKGIARNVFVEKTLASNPLQANDLCNLAESAGGINMVGYMKRFNVVFGKAKSLVQSGDFGEPVSFKAYAYSSDFLGLTKQSKSSANRGGALRDLGCHVIDLALWTLGDLEATEVLSIQRSEAGSEKAIKFMVANKEGLCGQIDVSQSMSNYRMPEFGLVVDCNKGRIEVNDDRLFLTENGGTQQKFYRHNLQDNVPFSIGEAEYFRENHHFINSIINDLKCEPSFSSAALVDVLIEQVLERGKEQ